MTFRNTADLDLGLSCPQGGRFWICANMPTRFLGCCRSNPCGTSLGACPDDDLEPAAWGADAAGKVPDQLCAGGNNNNDNNNSGNGSGNGSRGSWYACNGTRTAFLGCCVEDACKSGTCKRESLRAARLRDDAESMDVFLSHGNASVVFPTTSTAATSSAAATVTVTAPSRESGGGLGLSQHGHVVLTSSLIALTAVMALVAAGICAWTWTRRRGRLRHSSSSSTLPPDECHAMDDSPATMAASENDMVVPAVTISPPAALSTTTSDQPKPNATTNNRKGAKRQRDLGDVSSLTGPFEDEWGYPERE